MAADLTTVTKRVTSILNLQAPGTFSSTIASHNLDRHADEITELVREGALMVARAILANPNHAHRNLFIASSPTALTHGGELPDMASDADLIEIQRVAAGSYLPAIQRDVQVIESYRTNLNNVYSSLSHTTANSPLSGFYAVHNGRFYFTGNAAQGYFPAVSRTTVTSLIPDEYEDVWAAASIGLAPKEGDNILPVSDYYMNYAMANLSAVTSMKVTEPLASRGNV